MSQCVWQNIPSGNLNRLFEEIMFKNDEASVYDGNVSKNVVPIFEDLLDSCRVTGDVEVSSIKCRGRANASPNNRSKSHRNADGPDSIINVSIRRSHRVRGDT